MKITSLTISNFMSAADVQLAPAAKIVVCCGDNETGKSSTAEAIGVCLGQDPLRVALKKDYSLLVTTGAKVATIAMKSDVGEVSVRYPSGDIKGVIQPSAIWHAAMPAILKPGVFAASKPDVRRAFLFKLMQVENSPEATRQRLLGEPYKVREDLIPQIMQWLPGGFGYAASEAAKQAAEARGAWKAVTGEAYGAVKAATWKAEAPAPCEPPDRAGLQAAQESCDAARTELGRLHGLQQAHAGRESRISGLREQAAGFAAAEEAFNAADKLHEQWKQYVAKLEAKQPAPAVTSPAEVVCTGCGLIGEVKDGKLLPGVQQALPIATPPDPNLPKMLAEARETAQKAKASRDAAKRTRDAADAAARQLAVVDEAAGEPPTELQIRDAKIAVDEAADRLETAKATLHVAEHAERQAAEAKRQTEQAARHHADVEAWTAAGAALSPTGIPGELLAKALGPFNEKLAAHAKASGWRTVHVDADMTITVDGVLHCLQSESSQWRSDAMISAVCSELAGINMMLLDRFDVNSSANRERAIQWLMRLKWLDQAWVFATLKERPKLPEACEVHWFEAGVGR